MAPFKRYPGLRVTAVASVVSLLVLGLQTSAFATPPTISSFSPTSGPAGCVVVITGTNFKDPIVTSVDIGGTPVSEFKVVSGKEIWATVAGDASGTIHHERERNSEQPDRLHEREPGGLFPNHHVLHAMWWSGELGNSGGDHRDEPPQELRHGHDRSRGGRRAIRPYADTATHTGTPETPRQLNVAVPASDADGRIRVSTFNDIVGEGAVLSDAAFIVPTTGTVDCFDVIETSRSVTLRVVRSLVARGAVSADNGFTACAASVPVKIQRRVAGKWKTVRTTTTSPTGSYKRRIPDKPGMHRATAPRIFLSRFGGFSSCLRAISLTARTTS